MLSCVEHEKGFITSGPGPSCSNDVVNYQEKFSNIFYAKMMPKYGELAQTSFIFFQEKILQLILYHKTQRTMLCIIEFRSLH